MIAALLIFLAAPALAQGPDSVPAAARGDSRPVLEIARAAGEIDIDGDLTDPGWEGAARATDFTEAEPREGAEPAVRTEVLLSYDEKNLYVAFLAHGNPDEIRASFRERDQIFDDDFVGIVLDTYGDAAFGYLLLANPFGIQGDLQQAGQGQDPKIDLLFETAGRITPSGYQVEMSIPFSSFRFPDRPGQRWRVNLIRNLPRSSRTLITWAPLSRNNPCLLCQNGLLTGIEGVRPGSGLELLPSLVASQAGRLEDGEDPESFRSESLSADVSLGAKYAFPAGWTVEGTYNPDFSQVESDPAQVDVNTTFALFFPERRPFFQEGSDIFDTRVNVFYSRSINDPQVAAKVTGRRGDLAVGYVGAWDERTPFILPFQERSAIFQGGESLTNVLRVRRNLYQDSYVGGLLTDRRLEGGGSGSAASVDGVFRFGKVYRVVAQLVGSYTREPNDSSLTSGIGGVVFGDDGAYTAAFDGESFAGRAAYLNIAREARFWSMDVTYRDATPTFRADNGFQTRNDFRTASVWSDLSFYPQGSVVERVVPNLSAGTTWGYEGGRRDQWVRPGISLTLKRQTHVSLNGRVSREVFRGVEFGGIRNYNLFVSSNFSEPVQVGMRVGRSRTIARTLATPVLGEGTDFGAWATLKPTQRLVIEPSFNYFDLSELETRRELFSGYIARTRTSYAFSRELNARLVVQYNDFGEDWDVEPLLVYRLNPFSIFYVGSTHGFRDFGEELGLVGTDRQFFLKFQYLFRR